MTLYYLTEKEQRTPTENNQTLSNNERVGKKSVFLVIHTKKYSDDLNPLSQGDIPQWADWSGQSNKYGIFITYKQFKFIWNPDGYWFCEVNEDDIPENDVIKELGIEISRNGDQMFQDIENWDIYKLVRKIHGFFRKNKFYDM